MEKLCKIMMRIGAQRLHIKLYCTNGYYLGF